MSKKDEVYLEFLSNIDVLVDGRFILEKRNLGLLFRGSENQRLIDIKETFRCGKVVTLNEHNYFEEESFKRNYFNNSLDYITKKDYFNALLEITRFLTFLPNDEKGNELFVYLLYKNGKDDDYKKQLDLFEQKFKWKSKYLIHYSLIEIWILNGAF